MVEFDVGTPGQKAHLLFDTGSSTPWMVDAECADTCQHVNKGNRFGYNLSASSTGKLTGDGADMSYLGGTVSGPAVKDKFSAGGLTWDNTFIAANYSDWSSLAADGFVGLGFSSVADGGTKPVFEALMEKKLMDKPRFAIYYSREDGDDTHGKPGKGRLTLGDSYEDKYVEGDMVSLPLTTYNGDYALWQTPLHSTTGHQSGKNCSQKGGQKDKKIELNGITTTFDTGASGISLPESQIEDFYESIGMNWTAIISGDHIPLCSEFTKDWSLTFELGFYGETKNITIYGDQLRLPGFANREDACWPPFDTMDSDTALIGTRFLRNFYTVWDYGAFPGKDVFINPTLSIGSLKEGF